MPYRFDHKGIDKTAGKPVPSFAEQMAQMRGGNDSPAASAAVTPDASAGSGPEDKSVNVVSAPAPDAETPPVSGITTAEKTAKSIPASPSEKGGKKSRSPKKVSRTQASVYFLPNDYKKIRIFSIENDTSFSVFAERSCLDAMQASYRCHDPACLAEFVVSGKDGSFPKPICCPICGGKKLERKYR